MQAEVYVYTVCQSIEIPCSHVLCCDTSKSIIDRDFMIVEFIPSIVMLKARLTEEKRGELYVQMGNVLLDEKYENEKSAYWNCWTRCYHYANEILFP